MPECPTCEKSLTTERGVRQHHTKVHGESLPNRTCEGCGTDFYDPKARLSYCDDCEPNAGENNGNWKGARERTECERCSGEFGYYPSDKKGVYCPDCVREADEFLGDHYAEVHDIERVERECEYCGVDFEILASERKYGAGRFCSRDCLADWMSDTWSGDGHHQWLRAVVPMLAGGGPHGGERADGTSTDADTAENLPRTSAEIPTFTTSFHFERSTIRRTPTRSTICSRSVPSATGARRPAPSKFPDPGAVKSNAIMRPLSNRD